MVAFVVQPRGGRQVGQRAPLSPGAIAGVVSVTVERVCEGCGETFAAKTPRAVACSPRCQKRRQRGTQMPKAKPAPRGVSVTRSTRESLVAAGRVDTPLGQASLALAALLDGGEGPASGLAAVAKELRATLEEATRNAPRVDDPVDELASRRASRQAALRAN